MSKVHGRKAVFTVTDIGGSERDISNFCDNVQFPLAIDNAESSGFGDTDKTYLVGLRTRQIKITGKSGFGSNETDEVLSGLGGQGADGTVITTYKYGPAGSASGAVKYSGTVILTSYQPTSPLGGVDTFSADFQTNGSATRGTW